MCTRTAIGLASPIVVMELEIEVFAAILVGLTNISVEELLEV